jgi:hypothetical protein
VCIDWNWSLYVWNFECGTIIVIDPVKMIGGFKAVMHKHQQYVEKLHRVMHKHQQYVEKLHRGMSSCKEKLFKDPKIPMTDWAREFLSVDGAAGNR